MKFVEEQRSRRWLSRREIEASPAGAAWMRLRNRSTHPASVEVLKENEKTAVYRIHAADDERPLVAKCSSLASHRREAYVHKEVLRPLPTIRSGFVGALERAEEDHGWLFLENAGDETLEWNDAGHQTLASAWVGRLHAEAAANPAVAELAPRGADYYRSVLHDSVRLLHDAKELEPVAPFRPSVDRLVVALEGIDARWSAVVERLEMLPNTLVHGDFNAKNIRVLPGEGHGAATISVLDWEMAGYGTPAEDLVRVSVDAYGEGFGWPAAEIEGLRRAKLAGRALRHVVEIGWECRSLRTRWPYRSLRRFPSYAEKLRVVVSELDGVAA